MAEVQQSRTHEQIYAQFRSLYTSQRLAYRVASDSWEYEGRAISGGELSKLVAYDLNCGVAKATVVLAKASYDAFTQAIVRQELWLQSIEDRPKSDVTLRRWLKLMERRGATGIEHEANLSAMKQWLWQVHRGIRGQSVVWHVAPIFWSVENGTGKSFNLRRLVGPLAAFTRNINVDELGERFSGRLFARTLVAFLDEFAGAESASAGHLKAILTGKPIDARSMWSESGFYSANRMSCIATSNLTPPHGFIDTTGARRFWSIECQSKAMDGGKRRDELDAIDMDDIWACVRASDPSPHDDLPQAVAEYMEEVRDSRLRSRTSLEEFCAECLEPAPEQYTTLKSFQDSYRQYCEQTKQRKVTGGYRVLSEKLKDLGYTVVKTAQVYRLKHNTLVNFKEE